MGRLSAARGPPLSCRGAIAITAPSDRVRVEQQPEKPTERGEVLWGEPPRHLRGAAAGGDQSRDVLVELGALQLGGRLGNVGSGAKVAPARGDLRSGAGLRRGHGHGELLDHAPPSAISASVARTLTRG
jgi:hypothetical protein